MAVSMLVKSDCRLYRRPSIAMARTWRGCSRSTVSYADRAPCSCTNKRGKRAMRRGRGLGKATSGLWKGNVGGLGAREGTYVLGALGDHADLEPHVGAGQRRVEVAQGHAEALQARRERNRSSLGKT